jgi:putative sigma-54 modulation protein
MRITISGRGVEVLPGLREHAEARLKKLERYLKRIESVEITHSQERGWHVIEVMVNANGLLIRGEERSADARSAIDLVLEKVERQIRRSRGKWLDRVRSQEEWGPEELLSGEGEEETAGGRIVRTKRFTIKPMGPEEAAAQMELLGHDFYVFTNAETGQVNVLYRRRDGDYGLIEPDF